MRLLFWGWLFGLVFSLSGCASEPYMLPEPDDTSPAMTFRKAMPDRREYKPWEFYYKHCSVNGDQSVFPANAYDCNGPYY